MAAGKARTIARRLLPLLAVYTLARDRRDWRRLLWLLVPAGLLAGYQAWTHQLYGRGLLLDAAGYATMHRELSLAGLGQSSVIALCFTGGCTLLLLDWGNLLWSRPVAIAGVAAAVLVALVAWARLSDLAPSATGIPDWLLVLQIGILSRLWPIFSEWPKWSACKGQGMTRRFLRCGLDRGWKPLNLPLKQGRRSSGWRRAKPVQQWRRP